jgi:nuclear receptor subfamily 5 group A protein 2
MYKRDGALKQQKKALIRAKDLSWKPCLRWSTQCPQASAIQNIHSASKGLPLSRVALPLTDYDRSPFVMSPISLTMPPQSSLHGYQPYGHFPSQAIKSEYPDPYPSLLESVMGYSSSNGQAPQAASHTWYWNFWSMIQMNLKFKRRSWLTSSKSRVTGRKS